MLLSFIARIKIGWLCFISFKIYLFLLLPFFCFVPLLIKQWVQRLAFFLWHKIVFQRRKPFLSFFLFKRKTLYCRCFRFIFFYYVVFKNILLKIEREPQHFWYTCIFFWLFVVGRVFAIERKKNMAPTEEQKKLPKSGNKNLIGFCLSRFRS